MVQSDNATEPDDDLVSDQIANHGRGDREQELGLRLFGLELHRDVRELGRVDIGPCNTTIPSAQLSNGVGQKMYRVGPLTENPD